MAKSKNKKEQVSKPKKNPSEKKPAASKSKTTEPSVKKSAKEKKSTLNPSQNLNLQDTELDLSHDDIPFPLTAKSKKKRRYAIFAFLIILVISYFAKQELTKSKYQARYFHSVSTKLTSNLKPEDGKAFNSPDGPFDIRLGYSRLNSFFDNLKSNDFEQATHTEVSEKANFLASYGVNFPYKEKSTAGLEIKGDQGKPLYKFAEPTWVFPSFESISKLIVDTLLFIEDRTVLQTDNPLKNPAVEWDRFFKAILDLFLSKIFGERDVPGGSTLATQIEKFKHSEGGRTAEPGDKLRQMYSASLRAYNKSVDTTDVRKEIVLDYINSVPLAALKGFGEIHGLGDGLWAYYAEDPKALNELLKSDLEDEESLKAKAVAYRKVLSLFLAHRRPSDYLQEKPEFLQLQVDRYLPLLFNEGIISYDLFKTALASKVPHRRILPTPDSVNFSLRKGPNVVRSHLLSALKLDSLYELDRLDLEVNSTINIPVQNEISRSLVKLHSKEEIKKLGLDGFRLLSTSANPKKVIYSFTLFEHKDGVNRVRVQTDTFDQPLNINEGVKLDLGSTSKYRTIITYLEVVEEIFKKYSSISKSELAKVGSSEKDPISIWAIDWLKNQESPSLPSMLDAALNREYSANPGESFFTAGGLHHFENFNHDDNGKVLPIRLALRHSINLPFIRLMRDLVRYFTYHTEGSSALTLADMSEDRRNVYLKKFADQEGKIFLRKFFEKYQNKEPKEIFSVLLDSTKNIPKRFASIYWFINPNATLDEFIAFMKKHVDHESLNEKELGKYFEWYSVRATTLGDKGYLARMHPLELWLAAYLINHPKAPLSEILNNSAKERVEVYDWLMKTSRKHAQDKRIQILLEAEAFQEIYQRWKKVGYPLSSLVPSYATALGTSADRPDALAELMGIVLNDGKRYKKAIIEDLTFAKDTPYESSFKFKNGDPVQAISHEVAEIAKPLLFDIVAEGTAVRLKDGIKIGNNTYPVGGKTGTGDHRYLVYGKGGGLVEKRVVNRTATFMFIIGEKYFGVITAFVPGREAAQFKFTSALPVQLLKLLSPALAGLEEEKNKI